MKTSRLAKTGGIALASSMLLMGALPIASAMAASKPAVTLSGPSDVNQTAGSNVTYTASSSNVSNPVYQFWVEEPDGHWMMARGWSSSNTFTLKNVQDGDYLVTAYVAPKSNTKDTTNEQANGQQAVDGVFVDTSITVSAPSTLTAGQPVTVTATSANIYDAQYQFWYKTPSGKWMQSGNYGSSSYTFTPTETGSYEFVAYAKSPLALNDPEGAAMSTNSATTSVGVSTPSLSTISVSGETSGSGTASSPATSLNGVSLTATTTLMDADGNPVADTQITYNVSEYGSYTSTLPTVTNASGTVIAGTSGSSAEEYTAFTNSSGVASLTFAGPAGQTYAYEIQATAPYDNATGDVMSTPAYLEFVANNEAGISPLASNQDQAYGASLGTSVPITVAVPPTSSGVAQANVLVKLTTTEGYFTNAAGADLGTSIQVATNASGLASTMLTDASENTAAVTASLPATLGITNPPTTYIQFEQAGVATQIQNFGITDATLVPNGQDVTISGQLEDASGNPVASGQILVTGYDTAATNGGNSGDFGTVSGTTETGFPSVANPLSVGTPATSAFGTVVSTNSAGDFSFEVTDTAGGAYDAYYYIYGVENGDVTSPLHSGTITFASSTTLNQLAVAGSNEGLTNDDTTMSSTGVAYGTSNVWVEPQNAADAPLNGQSVTYNVSATNGGTIDALNGVALPNPVSGLTVEEAYAAGTGDNGYTITVPGESVSIPINFATTSGSGKSPMDIEIGVTNDVSGNTDLTITSGSEKATATIDFNGGAPDELGSVSPQSASMDLGQTQTVQMTVEDANGNPVDDVAIPVSLYTTGTADANLWLTSVNGVSLETSEYYNSATTTEPTPVPLFDSTTLLATAPDKLGYSSVTDAGVFSWTGANSAIVYTNSSGTVSFGVTAGDVSYYNADTSTGGIETSLSPTAPAEYVGYQNSNGFSIEFGATTGNVLNQQTVLTIGAGPALVTPISSATIRLSANTDTEGTPVTIYGTANTSGTVYLSGAGLSNQQVPVNGSDDYSYNFTPTETGTYPITVAGTSGGAALATSSDLTVTAAQSSMHLSSGTVVASSTTNLTVSGTVRQPDGTLVSGATVYVDADGASTTATTTSTGTYSASLTLDTAGTNLPVDVTVNGETISMHTDVVTVTAAALNEVTVGAFTQGGSTGAYTYSSTVALSDVYGNPIIGATATDFSASDASGDNLTVGSVTAVSGTPGSYAVVLDSTNTTALTDTATISVDINGTTKTGSNTL